MKLSSVASTGRKSFICPTRERTLFAALDSNSAADLDRRMQALRNYLDDGEE